MAGGGAPTRAEVLGALETVYDPCCQDRGISIVDMGVVDDVRIDHGGRVEVDLVLTTGWCPSVVSMSTAISERLHALGVDPADVRVEPRFERAWTMDRLSDSAKRKLTVPLEELVSIRERRVAGRPQEGA